MYISPLPPLGPQSSPVPSDPARCGYNKAAACLSLVLLIRSPATKPTVKAEAYACLDLVCPTSDDLFLFHYYFCRSINDAAALDAASGDGGDAAAGVDEGGTPVKRKKGNCTGGMRRALSRWYNSRDPLRLAVDATGIVNRYGQSHAELLKFYHPKPGSKALEIVFSCIGVRGRPHGRDKNKSLTEIVAAYEKTSNGLLEDEKARQVLAHYKKLAHLHRLVKNDVKMTDATRKKWATGEEAATAAGILADMQVDDVVVVADVAAAFVIAVVAVVVAVVDVAIAAVVAVAIVAVAIVAVVIVVVAVAAVVTVADVLALGKAEVIVVRVKS